MRIRSWISTPVVGRACFAITAVCAFVGLALNLTEAALNDSPAYVAGQFHTPIERLFNQLAYFTIESNLLLGFTSVLLALNLRRDSKLFSVLRLSGLVGVLVSAAVYHLVLAGSAQLRPLGIASTQLLHTVVPLLGILGWYLFRGERKVSLLTVGLSSIFPIAWLSFTTIRGTFIEWFPYDFVDVRKLGIDGLLVNCAGLALLLVAVAIVFMSWDRFLRRRRRAMA